jgi:hypothetical protein
VHLQNPLFLPFPEILQRLAGGANFGRIRLRRLRLPLVLLLVLS